MDALLEIIGTIPQHVIDRHSKELPWLRSLLSSTKEKVRESGAKIYGLTVARTHVSDFNEKITEIVALTKNGKNVETQHGALLALTHTVERKLTIKKEQGEDIKEWKNYVDVVNVICKCNFCTNFN